MSWVKTEEEGHASETTIVGEADEDEDLTCIDVGKRGSSSEASKI